MALQRIGEADPAALLGVLGAWIADGTWLELRAVAAALAHPPLLGDPAFALQALALAERVLEKARARRLQRGGRKATARCARAWATP